MSYLIFLKIWPISKMLLINQNWVYWFIWAKCKYEFLAFLTGLKSFLSKEKKPLKNLLFYKKFFWLRYCLTKMASSRAFKSYFESFRFYLPEFAVVTKATRSPRQINFIMSLSLRGQVITSDSEFPIQPFYTFEPNSMWCSHFLPRTFSMNSTCAW